MIEREDWYPMCARQGKDGASNSFFHDPEKGSEGTDDTIWGFNVRV
jgi:hypothetical protein